MKVSTRVLLLAALAGAVGLLAACASAPREVPPLTAGEVDLQRYQGEWYELARLPMFFQRKCAQSDANYHVMADGTLAVFNRCRTLEGKIEEASGVASPIAPGVTDRLEVRFDTWFSGLFPNIAKGPYWILYVDPDYKTAVVGSPDRKYLWLLARSPEVSSAEREKLLRIAREKGYNLDRLIWRETDAHMP